MTDRQSAQVSSRKRPKQARSTELVAAILEAGAQVLAKDGAQHFTTARVAEKAGVTLGNWSTGATFGDYDGDGRLDLVCAPTHGSPDGTPVFAFGIRESPTALRR